MSLKSSYLRRYRLSKWLDRFNKKLKKDRKKPEEVLTIIDSTPPLEEDITNDAMGYNDTPEREDQHDDIRKGIEK